MKSFLTLMAGKEGRKLGSVSYIFCSDKYLLNINRQFLNHDYFTDIITFDLSNDSSAIDSEIYISMDRVRDNAKTHNTTIKEELHRVIFHGVLHLCGYRDKTVKEEKLMRQKENEYLERYFK